MFLDYLSFVLIYVRVRSPSPGNLSKQPEAKGSGSTPSRSMRCQGLGVHFSSLLSRTERPPWRCRFKLQVLIMIRVCSAPGGPQASVGLRLGSRTGPGCQCGRRRVDGASFFCWNWLILSLSLCIFFSIWASVGHFHTCTLVLCRYIAVIKIVANFAGKARCDAADTRMHTRRW